MHYCSHLGVGCLVVFDPYLHSDQTAHRASLSKAACALEQKKNALGLSAQTDLYLLQNNKWLKTQTNAQALKIRIRERLRQRKFELERLECSYRGSSSGEWNFILA